MPKKTNTRKKSKKTKSKNKSKRREWATTRMSLTELQHLARSIGIPFGGLNKSELVYKINEYH